MKTYPALFYGIKGPWGVFVYYFNSFQHRDVMNGMKVNRTCNTKQVYTFGDRPQLSGLTQRGILLPELSLLSFSLPLYHQLVQTDASYKVWTGRLWSTVNTSNQTWFLNVYLLFDWASLWLGFSLSSLFCIRGLFVPLGFQHFPKFKRTFSVSSKVV